WDTSRVERGGPHRRQHDAVRQIENHLRLYRHEVVTEILGIEYSTKQFQLVDPDDLTTVLQSELRESLCCRFHHDGTLLDRLDLSRLASVVWTHQECVPRQLEVEPGERLVVLQPQPPSGDRFLCACHETSHSRQDYDWCPQCPIMSVALPSLPEA